MFDWLEKMRRAPVSKRRVAALGISLVFTGLVFTLWYNSLSNIFHSEDITAKNASFESPKDNFMANISTAWNGVTGQYSQLQSVLKSTDFSSVLYGNAEYQSTTSVPAIYNVASTSEATSSAQNQ